jgi:hypothetical protein
MSADPAVAGRSDPGKKSNATETEKFPSSNTLTKATKSLADQKLPLAFERNDGQFDAEVKFFVRAKEYEGFLTSSGPTLVVKRKSRKTNKPKSGKSNNATTDIVKLSFAGGNPSSEPSGLNKLSRTTNRYLGNDPKRWQTGIETYSAVKYENIYKGVVAINANR